MIKIDNVSKTFLQNGIPVQALDDVTVHIEKGGIYGIIGMSGAGKSTLLRCLAGLEKPDSGSITVAGTDLVSAGKATLAKIRKNMGVVFQGYNLLMQRTVYENIAFPLRVAGTDRKQTEQRVDRLLKVVGLEDKKYAYPSQLSGGQKQRVAIARALATQPSILLCDEPTSALDPQTTGRVLALLKEINRSLGVTIVIITHEISVVRNICSHVAVLSQGAVAESGKVARVFTSPKTHITKALLDWRV